MPSRITIILVIFVGVAIIILGVFLYEITGISLPVCSQPPTCSLTICSCYSGPSGGVSHIFYFEAIIVSLIGIAIVIIGFVMAYQRLTYMQEFKLERQKLRDLEKKNS
jgi:hypothetical protein